MQIPDHISFKELESLAESAKTEDTSPEIKGDITPDKIVETASNHIDLAYEEVNDPMVHKVMMMQITNNMFQWHMASAQQEVEKGDLESAACWMRDAGQWQVVLKILRDMKITPDDFTCA